MKSREENHRGSDKFRHRITGGQMAIKKLALPHHRNMGRQRPIDIGTRQKRKAMGVYYAVRIVWIIVGVIGGRVGHNL